MPCRDALPERGLLVHDRRETVAVHLGRQQIVDIGALLVAVLKHQGINLLRQVACATVDNACHFLRENG
jgi:hypothetical protein